MFVPGETFQISLMFASKAGAFSRGASLKNLTLILFYFTYPKTLDKAGKACPGQLL